MSTEATGSCDAGLVFHVERGHYGTTRLDGLSFAVLLHTPGPMIQGNWNVGVIVDERASAEQRQALTAIASGQEGGPMAALSPLIGRFEGTAAKPIAIEKSALGCSVSIPGALEMSIEGIAGANQGEPIYLDNVGREPARVGKGLEQPHARLWHPLGRHVGQEQWPLRAVQLELQLTSRTE